MGLLSKIFSVGAAEPVSAIGDILDELFTSDEEELKLEAIKLRLLQKPQLAQTKINAVQATHRSIFVAGARPFLMWVCGLGFLFAFVINPTLQWLWPEIGSPALPLEVMMELTLGMLGLAGLRTVEKIKGVSK
ncbi:3TM-type holin [Pseudoalteromonas sp. T1lg65]|uniref:3TM-type holin n=1 Tax=Pseudoalteromonas sp. T1lg65 TaxID=2077101 RepID=UPI003F7B0616